MIRRKRNVLEILEDLVEALLSERSATKTRLTAITGLNLTTFNRYVELLRRAGALEGGRDEQGRVVYAATPRAAALLLVVRMIGRIVDVDPGVLERYRRLVGEIAARLSSDGFLVRLGRVEPVEGRDEAVFYDMVAVKGCALGLLLGLYGDPLNYVRLWSLAATAAGLRPAGIDRVIAAGDDELFSRIAEKLGFRVVGVGVEPVVEEARAACG